MDGLIFDIDGTLWDTVDPCLEGWKRVLERRALDARVTRADIVGLMGKTHQETLGMVLQELDPALRAEVVAECYLAERESIQARGGRVYRGAREGLGTLSESRPLFLVSNCGEEYLRLFLDLTGFGPLFKDSLCHGRTGRPKSDNIRTVADRNSLRSPVYVGDTSMDHRAAMTAGTEYWHMNYGFGEPVEDCRTFDTFDQLVEHVGGMNGL